jgi:dTDP-4-amino-4,6-dideoxygalactose transaminase
MTAILALDLPPKSEMILAAYNWPQLLAVAAALGIKAQLVDCDLEGRISPEAVEQAIRPHTRVIVACHLFGNPVDIQSLARIAKQYQIYLIEDCSQALLASQQGHLVGRWGDMAIASLGAAKMLSAGEGGILFTNRLDLLTRAARVSQHPARWPRQGLDYTSLWQSLSLRMHPAGARQAHKDLNDWNDRATHVNRLHFLLRSLLADESQLQFPNFLPGSKPMWQHCPLLIHHSRAAQALASLTWDQQPAYLLKNSPRWPQSRQFARQVAFIQSGREWVKLRDNDVADMAQKIYEALHTHAAR